MGQAIGSTMTRVPLSFLIGTIVYRWDEYPWGAQLMTIAMIVGLVAAVTVIAVLRSRGGQVHT